MLSGSLNLTSSPPITAAAIDDNNNATGTTPIERFGILSAVLHHCRLLINCNASADFPN